MEFTKELCKSLSKEIVGSLAEIAAKYNINIKTGRGQFDTNSFSLKLEISTISESGVVQSKERTSWNLYAISFGLKPEWLDKIFTFQGDKFKIEGLNTKRHKYPVLAKNIRTNRMHIFHPTSVKAHMLSE
jgi:hypothetical protein